MRPPGDSDTEREGERIPGGGRLQWSRLTPGTDLETDAVHVWWSDLRRFRTRLEEFTFALSPLERERAEGYRRPEDRDRFILRRGILRCILSRYLAVPLREVVLEPGPSKKPRLPPALGRDLRFNLSRSDDVVLYAVTRGREIGVDLEPIRPFPEARRLAERFFASGEVARLRATAASESLAAFFTCWTRKEAFLKARGDGLGFPLNGFEVSVDPAEPARLVGVTDDPGATDRWWLADLRPATGYAAAVAGEMPRPRILRGTWT